MNSQEYFKMNKVKKLVCLSASWCMPCKAYHKTIEEIEKMEEFKDIEFLSYDVEDDDEGVDMSLKYMVRGVPTTLMFNENGEVIERFSGNIPQSTVIEKLKAHL